jgi:hypothetical protein
MPIEVALDPEYAFIIQWRYIGAWRWSEFEVALEQAASLLDAASEPLYNLSDFTRSSLMPADLFSSLRRYLTPQAVHPNSARMIVVVGADVWIERWWRFLNRMYFTQFAGVYVPTLEEGRKQIIEERQRCIHNAFAD